MWSSTSAMPMSRSSAAFDLLMAPSARVRRQSLQWTVLGQRVGVDGLGEVASGSESTSDRQFG